MESFKEYAQYDGLGLADLVRKREVSPEELCETAIERIEATLFRLARQLETERPWFDKRPKSKHTIT